MEFVQNFADMLDYIFVHPFPQLGTFLSYFASDLLVDIEIETPNYRENLYKFLANLLFDLYEGQITNNMSLYDLYSWGSLEESGAFFNM